MCVFIFYQLFADQPLPGQLIACFNIHTWTEAKLTHQWHLYKTISVHSESADHLQCKLSGPHSHQNNLFCQAGCGIQFSLMHCRRQAGRSHGIHDLLFCFALIHCIHWHSCIMDVNVKSVPRRGEKKPAIVGCFFCFFSSKITTGPAGFLVVLAVSMINNSGIHHLALIAAPHQLYLYLRQPSLCSPGYECVVLLKKRQLVCVVCADCVWECIGSHASDRRNVLVVNESAVWAGSERNGAIPSKRRNSHYYIMPQGW